MKERKVDNQHVCIRAPKAVCDAQERSSSAATQQNNLNHMARNQGSRQGASSISNKLPLKSTDLSYSSLFFFERVFIVPPNSKSVQAFDGDFAGRSRGDGA